MVRVRAVLFAVSLFGLAGCGSSSGKGQAAADCEAFIAQHFCPAVYACGVYASVSQCVTTADAMIDCGTVQQVTGDLAQCETAVDTDPCGQLVDYAGNATLPTACYGVFSR